MFYMAQPCSPRYIKSLAFPAHCGDNAKVKHGTFARPSPTLPQVCPAITHPPPGLSGYHPPSPRSVRPSPTLPQVCPAITRPPPGLSGHHPPSPRSVRPSPALPRYVRYVHYAGMLSQMSLVVRKPVFGVSDQVSHKPGCAVTEDG